MKKIVIGSITIVMLAGGYSYAMGPAMMGGMMGGHGKADTEIKDRQNSHKDHSNSGEGDMKNGQSEMDHHSMMEEHHNQMGHDETEMKEKGDAKNKGHEH